MSKHRYPSDLTDREWKVLEPLLPEVYEPSPQTGRPRVHSYREIMNGVFYVLRSGCSWRMLPKDLPPWQSVYHKRIWADQGYTGEFKRWAEGHLELAFKVVYPWWRQIERYLLDGYEKQTAGFKVIPRRWVVERTFAWWTFQRRLNRDYDLLPTTTESFIYLAMIRLMLRRLAFWSAFKQPLSLMGTIGDVLDNAVAESFFTTWQVKLLDRQRWATCQQLITVIFGYTEVFFKRQQLHSTLGYLSPSEFKEVYALRQAA